MNETPLRVLIVDDHPLVRQGIHSIVTSEPGMSVAAEASTGLRSIGCPLTNWRFATLPSAAIAKVKLTGPSTRASRASIG